MKNLIAASARHHMAAVAINHVQRHKWARCRHSWNVSACAVGQPCRAGGEPPAQPVPPLYFALLAAEASSAPAHVRALQPIAYISNTLHTKNNENIEQTSEFKVK